MDQEADSLCALIAGDRFSRVQMGIIGNGQDGCSSPDSRCIRKKLCGGQTMETKISMKVFGY